MFPVKIQVNNNIFSVEWDNNSVTNIKLANLRNGCPCAICSTERSMHSSEYIPIYSDEQLTITEVKVIGNYALGVSWKDKHDTGIYDYNYLTKLASKNY